MKIRHFVFLLFISFSFSSCDFDCDDPGRVEIPETDIPRPVHIYPTSNSVGQSRTPIFIWDGRADEADGAVLNFTLVVHRSVGAVQWSIPAGTDTFLQFPDTLEAETPYEWRILSESEEGETAECFDWMFYTGTTFNNPPARVVFTDAWDCDTIRTEVPLDAVLTWECFDPDGDALSYDLYYWRDLEDDSTHVSDIPVPEFGTALDADTRYDFRVWAKDEHGGIGSRNFIMFHTVTTPPPHDPTPEDGAEDVPTDLTLSWSCADPDGDALTYDVEMGYAGSGRSLIATGISQDELPVTGLTEGRTYEWMVTAEDDDGHRTEGPVWSFRTIGVPGDVFADLTLTRRQSISITETVIIDNMWARFDEGYAPQYAIHPLQPPSVSCGGIDLSWVEANHRYYYENAHALTFLVPGTEYTFSVAEGGGVPALTASVTFPQCAPVITSPQPFGFVSMDGFEVAWTGHDAFPDCDRPVSIAILDIMGDSTGVRVSTENDGSYTFTAGELSSIDPSLIDLQIVLSVENATNIDAEGYDPRSWIRARTLAVITVYQD